MQDSIARTVSISMLMLITLSVSGCSLYRTFFPSSAHESVAPDVPDAFSGPAVLIFSKTNGFRHDEAIDAGLPLFRALAERRGWEVFTTENGAVHDPELLERFDVVVWFQVSGDVLDEAQRRALQSWIASGGSFFGVHGTGGDPNYEWDWHPDTLVGAQFIGHPMNPQFQEATILVEDRNHPATKHLDAQWIRTDEWYSFEESPREQGAHVLATLDESTYSPRMKMLWMDDDLSMGKDHPIIWVQCIGSGRSLYSALGHLAEAYSEPDHTKFLEESIAWLIAARGDDCIPPSR